MEFEFSLMRMQISEAVIHAHSLLDVDNSSHHSQLHSIIVKVKMNSIDG